jgi:hypothetical protein
LNEMNSCEGCQPVSAVRKRCGSDHSEGVSPAQVRTFQWTQVEEGGLAPAYATLATVDFTSPLSQRSALLGVRSSGWVATRI